MLPTAFSLNIYMNNFICILKAVPQGEEDEKIKKGRKRKERASLKDPITPSRGTKHEVYDSSSCRLKYNRKKGSHILHIHTHTSKNLFVDKVSQKKKKIIS